MKTYNKKKSWKEAFTRFLLVAFLINQCFGNAFAKAIPTGDVDLNVLLSIAASLTDVNLMKWRTGVPNQAPQGPVNALTFAYFTGATAGSKAVPDRSNVTDKSANNQNDIWSDNVLEVKFTKGNDLSSAILLYTANHAPLVNGVETGNDPLRSVALRGGLVGCINGTSVPSTNPSDAAAANPTCTGDTADPSDPGRQVIVPLIWKAVPLAALKAVSTATVTGSNPIPDGSPVVMPTEITQVGVQCPLEFGYKAGDRPTDFPTGFCDFSTHYVVDKYNLDKDNLHYESYPKATDAAKRLKVFNYESVIGRFGINAQEAGTGGGGAVSPAYVLLGIGTSGAVPAHYGTTIYVEKLTY